MNKIIEMVNDYAVMFAEKGEKATYKAWENTCKENQTLAPILIVSVTLCLRALFARGDMTFIDAMFAEKDAAKLFDYKFRESFLPDKFRNSKQYKKWIKVELAEHELASWWAYLNLPFLKDILDKVTADLLESQSYLSEAYIIRDTFLETVRDVLGSESPSFIDILVQDMTDTFKDDLDLEEYGYDNEGYEAKVWKEFCWDNYGLKDILEQDYSDFLYEVAEEMLNAVV